MKEWLRSKWVRWFGDSETIFYARLQTFIGIVIEAWKAVVELLGELISIISVVDLSPILPSRWLSIYLVVNGVIMEVLRRRRATDLDPPSGGT